MWICFKLQIFNVLKQYGRGKGKGKVHPRIDHAGPEGEWRYSSYLSLTFGGRWEVGGQRHATAALTPLKRPGTHCIGGWVGPGPLRTAAKKFTTTRIRFPDSPGRSE